jgi:hypothetical protein
MMGICGNRPTNRFFPTCAQPGTTHNSCQCGADVQAEIDAQREEDE